MRPRLGRLLLVAFLVSLFQVESGMAVESVAPISIDLQAASPVERLMAAIELYRALARNEGWPVLPQGATLKKGARDDRVPILRRRLAMTGDISELATSGSLFDESLNLAVRRFQVRHGLAVDGIVGSRTRAALNVPVATRLAMLELNLLRLRALAPAAALQIVVNTAAAELEVIEAGRVVLRSRVVVGRPDRRTPELQSAVRWIEFNPSWTVPPRIAAEELLPKAKEDPDYLVRRAFRVYAGWGKDARELDPHRVDWSSTAAQTYVLRQQPGSVNPLGPVKFVFPNIFDVYLHDTSAPQLFDRTPRTFSHGCVRVEGALDLAAILLGWSRKQVDKAVASGATTVVQLPNPVSIQIVYITAWVDEDGVIQFRDDVYRLDDQTMHAPQVGAAAAMEG